MMSCFIPVTWVFISCVAWATVMIDCKFVALPCLVLPSTLEPCVAFRNQDQRVCSSHVASSAVTISLIVNVISPSVIILGVCHFAVMHVAVSVCDTFALSDTILACILLTVLDPLFAFRKRQLLCIQSCSVEQCLICYTRTPDILKCVFT